jgi:hypothetical protein
MKATFARLLCLLATYQLDISSGPRWKRACFGQTNPLINFLDDLPRSFAVRANHTSQQPGYGGAGVKYLMTCVSHLVSAFSLLIAKPMYSSSDGTAKPWLPPSPWCPMPAAK